MRERIDSVGGQFEVYSAAGKGTRIHVEVPFRAAASKKQVAV
jgi:signal transduction histidine kinase